MTPRIPRLAFCLPILLSAAGLAMADDKADLARDKPVPDSEQIPMADFYRPEKLIAPSFNHAGDHIAALVAAGDKRLLLVYDIDKQKPETVEGGAGDKDISAYTWLDDHRLIFEIDARKLFGLGIFATEVGSLGDAYPIVQNYGSSVVSVPLKDRLHPLVWNRFDFQHDGKNLGVSRVNTDLRGGKILNLSAAGTDYSQFMDARDDNVRHTEASFPIPEPGIGTGFAADREGSLAFATTSLKGKPLFFRMDGDKWVQCPVDLDDTTYYGCGNEPGQIVIQSPRVEGKPRALVFMDAATGKVGDILEEEKAYDFNGWLYRDPQTREIIGAFSERAGPHVVWFNDVYRDLQKVFNAYFPGQYVQIVGSNDAQDRFLILNYSDTQPGQYHWVNLADRHLNNFMDLRPWLDPKRMQPENIFRFKTRDGHVLEAYLTLPKGASKASPVPLIVIPHGGPWIRDNWGFDGEAQFWASRGYAVLKPNYRASPGYDWMFPISDQWDFLKMHNDVTDATKGALATGLFDAHRVAIMGSSFGGYLALQGVVREPNLYRCAITIAGVFDWEKLIADKKFDYEHSASNPEFDRLMRRLGDPKQEPEKFDAISPVRHVDQIKVPVFVNHGDYDPVSDVTQSTRLISELERYHVPHEGHIVSDEAHGMAHLSSELELTGQIEAFLAKNMAP